MKDKVGKGGEEQGAREGRKEAARVVLCLSLSLSSVSASDSVWENVTCVV